MNTWLNLKDNVIIVTGGASGIGLAIVDELLSQGAHVQMIDIHGGDRHHNGDNYTSGRRIFPARQRCNRLSMPLFSAGRVLMVWSITLA